MIFVKNDEWFKQNNAEHAVRLGKHQ